MHRSTLPPSRSLGNLGMTQQSFHPPLSNLDNTTPIISLASPYHYYYQSAVLVSALQPFGVMLSQHPVANGHNAHHLNH